MYIIYNAFKMQTLYQIKWIDIDMIMVHDLF